MRECLLPALAFVTGFLCCWLTRRYFAAQKVRAEEIPSADVSIPASSAQEEPQEERQEPEGEETRDADPAYNMDDQPTDQIFMPDHQESGPNTLFSLILNHIPCQVFIKDARNDFQYKIANRNFLDYYQLEESNVIGHSDNDLFDPETAEQLRRHDTEVCANPGYVFHYDENVSFHRTKRVFFKSLKICFQTHRGHPFLLGICVDVTELKDKADRLQKTQEFLNTVIDSLPIPIFAKDAGDDFRYSIVNENFTRFFGLTPEEIIGKTDGELVIDPADGEKFLRQDREVMAGCERLEFDDCPHDRNGIRRNMRVYKVAAVAPDGRHILLGAATDLTMQAALLRNERANSDILAKAVTENDFAAIIDSIFEETMRILPLDRIMLLRVDGDEVTFYREKYSADNRSIFATGLENHQRIWKSLLKRLKQGESIIHDDMQNIPSMADFLKKYPDDRTRSFGAHAIYVDGEIAGILTGAYNCRFQFGESDTTLISSMCNIISMMIVRERQNRTIREEREQNQAILDNVNIPLWLYDQNGVIVRSNRAGNEIAPLEKFQGVPYACRKIFDCQMNVEQCTVRQALLTGLPVRRPWSYGGCKYLAGARPLFNAKGGVTYVSKSLYDVTELIEREDDEKLINRCLASVMPGTEIKEALKSINQMLCEHFHGDRSYIMHLDVDNFIVESTEEYCAPGIEPILSKIERQPFNKESHWFRRLNDHQWIDFDVEKSMNRAHNPGDWGIWEHYVRAAGVKRFYSMPIFLHGKLWGNWGMTFERENVKLADRHLLLIESIGQMLELILIRQMYDVTLSDALKQAQAATRAKSAFLSTISHELRTPLNSVIGFSDLLADANVSPRDVAEYANGINLSSKALLSLINDLLDFSKLEADQMRIVTAPTDLKTIFRELQAVFHQTAAAKDLTLNFSIRPDFPILGLDDLRVRQILMNLIGNALKYTSVGSVTITAEYGADGALTLAVADTGIGVEPEARQRIFEPFIQQDAVRDSKVFKGTGLGLAIVKTLVEKMGGRIELASELGKGATFTMILPSVERYDRSAAASANDDGKSVNTALKVLLVDDVTLNLNLFERMLKKLNITNVRKTTSATEALAILDESPIDILFTDMWMPEMDGVALANIIRENPRFDSVRLYVVTADVDARITLAKSLFSGVLLKPITLKDIERLVSES